MFGTEKVICPKNSEGWMVGVWDGLNLDWSKLSWELFGLIQTFFYLYPNSIQTGGVVQFCHFVLFISFLILSELQWTASLFKFTSKLSPENVNANSLPSLNPFNFIGYRKMIMHYPKEVPLNATYFSNIIREQT